ncbi:MAG: transporter, partial [Limisphaerales bacterium]
MKKQIVSIIVAALAGATSFGADHQNLEEGLPVSVEDAYPIAYRGREIQSVFRYDRTHDDKNRVTLEPRIELGIAPNTEFEIRAPFYLGNADRTGSGDIALGVLYNFNTESLMLPAFSLGAEGVVPTGKDSRGFDTAVKFIVTKSVSKSGLDRIHLNL